MRREVSLYKRVDTEGDRKLRYEGPCSKCHKITPHRLHGGSMVDITYRCMKCGTINIEPRMYGR